MPNEDRLRITLLDVGAKKYGDCILAQFGDISVLVDGAHVDDFDGSPGHHSIPDQIGFLLGDSNPPYHINLLIVTHPHDDHIGLLPLMVNEGLLEVDYALVADPMFRWGQEGSFAVLDTNTRALLNALQEENRSDESDEELRVFFANLGDLEMRYRNMLRRLEEQGTRVIRNGVDNPTELIDFLESRGVRLNIVGPSRQHLDECARLLNQNTDFSMEVISNSFAFDADPNLIETYRSLANASAVSFAVPLNKGAINLQSIITIFEYQNKKVCLAGDFQFWKPEVSSDFLNESVANLREQVKNEAPFYFYKISHHGSYNAFSEEIFSDLGDTEHLGMVGGTNDRSHPEKSVLQVLRSHNQDVKWIRTDHNGQSSVSSEGNKTEIKITKGRVNDWTENTGSSPRFSMTPDLSLTPGNQPRVDVKLSDPDQTNIEITAKVPNTSTKVTLTIDVAGESLIEAVSPTTSKSSETTRGDFEMSARVDDRAPEDRRENVLVEMRAPRTDASNFAMGMMMAAGLSNLTPSFQIDPTYEPVEMGASGFAMSEGENTLVLRGKIDPEKKQELKRHPDVVDVWDDPKIAPFEIGTTEKQTSRVERLNMGFDVCPLPPCDCQPGIAKGSIADVARFLGVNEIWDRGFRGEGIVVGVVDSGITADGRISTGTIPRVIDGWVSDWGKKSVWGGHGNMCATDVLGMAPQASLYDLRIGDAQTIEDLLSTALKAFDWAIKRHRLDGTPQILTNSWGIYQESWGPRYAVEPAHIFTRKVIEAIDAGIIVLFAAGNCGQSCPDDRCGSDAGPGKSIWGANGHPAVMTVGAANINEQFVGYSSQGPAALDANKPDFCSISHFKGFFASDTGTSAACPIAAGVVALFKQARSSLTQREIKNGLRTTAKGIGGTGWNPHSGAGIIQPKAAFDILA